MTDQWFLMFSNSSLISFAWTHIRASMPVWADSVMLLAEYEYCLCQLFADASMVDQS